METKPFGGQYLNISYFLKAKQREEKGNYSWISYTILEKEPVINCTGAQPNKPVSLCFGLEWLRGTPPTHSPHVI